MTPPKVPGTPPLPLEECGIWPYDEPEQHYAEFIIGLDEHGNPRQHTCAPEKLANYFVGQIVGTMNKPKGAAQVVIDMIEEFIESVESLAKQLEY